MNRLAAISLSFVLLGGCKSTTVHSAHSKTKSAVTARADGMMHVSIDSELAREKRGERPSAGKKTWREFWEWRISLWRKDKGKKFEQYLTERRQALGLKRVRDI